jgi:hypothetical protein
MADEPTRAELELALRAAHLAIAELREDLHALAAQVVALTEVVGEGGQATEAGLVAKVEARTGELRHELAVADERSTDRLMLGAATDKYAVSAPSMRRALLQLRDPAVHPGPRRGPPALGLRSSLRAGQARRRGGRRRWRRAVRAQPRRRLRRVRAAAGHLPQLRLSRRRARVDRLRAPPAGAASRAAASPARAARGAGGGAAAGDVRRGVAPAAAAAAPLSAGGRRLLWARPEAAKLDFVVARGPRSSVPPRGDADVPRRSRGSARWSTAGAGDVRLHRRDEGAARPLPRGGSARRRGLPARGRRPRRWLRDQDAPPGRGGRATEAGRAAPRGVARGPRARRPGARDGHRRGRRRAPAVPRLRHRRAPRRGRVQRLRPGAGVARRGPQNADEIGRTGKPTARRICGLRRYRATNAEAAAPGPVVDLRVVCPPRCPNCKLPLRGGAPLPSSRTPTQARPRSPRSSSCSAAPSSWPAPSRRAAIGGAPAPTG